MDLQGFDTAVLLLLKVGGFLKQTLFLRKRNVYLPSICMYRGPEDGQCGNDEAPFLGGKERLRVKD